MPKSGKSEGNLNDRNGKKYAEVQDFSHFDRWGFLRLLWASKSEFPISCTSAEPERPFKLIPA
jgi:hypothetical protein